VICPFNFIHLLRNGRRFKRVCLLAQYDRSTTYCLARHAKECFALCEKQDKAVLKSGKSVQDVVDARSVAAVLRKQIIFN
jgi:hypothetical protein